MIDDEDNINVAMCCCEYYEENEMSTQPTRRHMLDCRESCQGSSGCCCCCFHWSSRAVRIPWPGGAKAVPVYDLLPLALIPTLWVVGSQATLFGSPNVYLSVATVLCGWLFAGRQSLKAQGSRFCFIWLLGSVVMLDVAIVREGHTALALTSVAEDAALPTHWEIMISTIVGMVVLALLSVTKLGPYARVPKKSASGDIKVSKWRLYQSPSGLLVAAEMIVGMTYILRVDPALYSLDVALILVVGVAVAATMLGDREDWEAVKHLCASACMTQQQSELRRRRVGRSRRKVLSAFRKRIKAQAAQAVADAPSSSKAFCDACGHAPRPPLSKHCRSCNMCVLRFDHHCVWIDTCVGLGNHRTFVVAIAFSVGILIQSASLCFRIDSAYAVANGETAAPPTGAWRGWQQVRHRFSSNSTSLLFVIGMYAVIAACVLGVLLSAQAIQIVSGVTTYERIVRRRRGLQKPKATGSASSNCFAFWFHGVDQWGRG